MRLEFVSQSKAGYARFLAEAKEKIWYHFQMTGQYLDSLIDTDLHLQQLLKSFHFRCHRALCFCVSPLGVYLSTSVFKRWTYQSKVLRLIGAFWFNYQLNPYVCLYLSCHQSICGSLNLLIEFYELLLAVSFALVVPKYAIDLTLQNHTFLARVKALIYLGTLLLKTSL